MAGNSLDSRFERDVLRTRSFLSWQSLAPFLSNYKGIFFPTKIEA